MATGSETARVECSRDSVEVLADLVLEAVDGDDRYAAASACLLAYCYLCGAAEQFVEPLVAERVSLLMERLSQACVVATPEIVALSGGAVETMMAGGTAELM